MREQLWRNGTLGPEIDGIDEIAIRNGHTYRIVVSERAPAGYLARRQ